MRPVRTVAVLIVALLLGSGLAACGSASKTEKSFDDWIKDNPVPGADLVSRSATNSIFGRNEIFADYRLTAAPSASAIEKAMKGACGFNSHTSAMPRYTLAVDTIKLEVACIAANQAKIGAFWEAVHSLPFRSMIFSQGGVSIDVESSTEAFSDDVLGRVITAAKADDLVSQGQYSQGGGGTTVNVSDDGDLTAALTATRKLMQVSSGKVANITVLSNQVIASSEASVAQARAWEDAVNGSAADPIVAVGSAKTYWSVLPPDRKARDLVDQIASRSDVSVVRIETAGWTVETDGVPAAEKLLGPLSSQTGSSLGDLTLQAALPDVGRTCEVAIDAPGDVAAARGLLGLCRLPSVDVGVALVEDKNRPEISFERHQVTAVVKQLHQLPAGTTVQLTEQTSYAAVTLVVGDPVQVTPVQDTSKQFANRVRRAWAATG